MHIIVDRCLFVATDLIWDHFPAILPKTKPVVGYFCFWNLLVCNFAFQRKIIHAQVRVRFIGRLWQSIHFTQKVACVTSTWQLTRKKKTTHDNWIYLVKYPFCFGDEQKLFFAIWERVGFLRRLQNFLTFDVKCMFTVNVTTLPALYITRRLES